MFHMAKLSIDMWFYKGGRCGCLILINKRHSWEQSALCAIRMFRPIWANCIWVKIVYVQLGSDEKLPTFQMVKIKIVYVKIYLCSV